MRSLAQYDLTAQEALKRAAPGADPDAADNAGTRVAKRLAIAPLEQASQQVTRRRFPVGCVRDLAAELSAVAARSMSVAI